MICRAYGEFQSTALLNLYEEIQAGRSRGGSIGCKDVNTCRFDDEALAAQPPLNSSSLLRSATRDTAPFENTILEQKYLDSLVYKEGFSTPHIRQPRRHIVPPCAPQIFEK